MKASAKALDTTITVHVPLKFALRGGRKTVLVPTPNLAPRTHIDNALIKAIARAYRWRRLIETGEYASITELAKAEGVNQSYACRLLRLTLLAPDIVSAIIDGRHNPDWTLKKIMKPTPVDWAEQRKRGLA